MLSDERIREIAISVNAHPHSIMPRIEAAIRTAIAEAVASKNEHPRCMLDEALSSSENKTVEYVNPRGNR